MIQDPPITAAQKFEEDRRKHSDLIKKRKAEGKKFKLQVDYTIRVHDDKEFEFVAIDLQDAIDQVYAELADDHNVEEVDIDLEVPEVLSVDAIATTPPPPLACPACGSTEIVAKAESRCISVPYGPEVEYACTIYTCSACGSQGDFTGENDAKIQKAKIDSEIASANFMLDQLTKGIGDRPGLTPTYIERALRNKIGTVKLWRLGLISDTALSLLRIIHTFPWLLQVSDADFHPEITRTILRSYIKRLNAAAPNSLFPIHRSQEASTACNSSDGKIESESSRSET